MAIDWTREQRRILDHSVDRSGRVLAGPGTGKSTTVLTLASRLQELDGTAAVGVATFTRAATAELASSASSGGHGLEPTTLHSFALSLLMKNPSFTDLPAPLRIPDSWESKRLVQAEIARRLKDRGFSSARLSIVRRLEREMAARWESLDPELVTLADIEPELRNAYLGVWRQHRATYGYSLFAEMPLKAAELLEDHPDVDLHGLELFIVDEYQDLNRCEVGLLQALTRHGVRILAVGDDDQSIYGFRMADPAGIRNFPDDFDDAEEYTLSVSLRCGEDILTPARDLIEMAARRSPKPRLAPRRENPPGVFEYLSFRNEAAERRGVAGLVDNLVEPDGIRPSDVIIMVRGDHNDSWSGPLREELDRRGIEAVDVEEALEPLKSREARKAIALGRLAVNRHDDLAWWGLLKTTNGISDTFISMVADGAAERGERFSARLLVVADDPINGAPRPSTNKATTLIREVLDCLDDVDLELVPAAEDGWATWLLGAAEEFGVATEESFVEILSSVGSVTPQSEGIGHFLNQLEPVTRDLALEVDAVAIMSMSRAKGLTRRVAITMGVENGVIPSPRASDEEEERRLLYVAMTRARDFCYLTMATRRTDRTAFAGGGVRPRATRGRSPFFSGTPIRPRDGAAYLRELQEERDES